MSLLSFGVTLQPGLPFFIAFHELSHSPTAYIVVRYGPSIGPSFTCECCCASIAPVCWSVLLHVRLPHLPLSCGYWFSASLVGISTTSSGGMPCPLLNATSPSSAFRLEPQENSTGKSRLLLILEIGHVQDPLSKCCNGRAHSFSSDVFVLCSS